ncbi:ABC transporter ATP-binding protein [Acetobacter okinawensis]|uniref:dipeptide ABC transporter ATP-binding protein n=1 Tax=Acetobacter okinawensis TaxID=1076594 RepID=UPI001BAA9C37|nr:ABC transporter ATP-binding protein [Acetobacter okinawensis]MBS0965916.1 ABC transporter ATP-binding protein [Acetobacter okinawensis]
MTQTCLSIHDLDISYTRHGSIHQALNHVSLDLHAGEMLALVGESGSGKSTLGRAVLGILPPNASVQHGSIHLGAHNVTHLSERAWQQIRGKKVALIPQDPAHSLDPVRTIGAQLAEALRPHKSSFLKRSNTRAEAIALLDQMGISRPAQRLGQYPHELSGGMRQRVLIAAAIAQRPALIVADEPTSALDVSVQVQIMALLATLRRELGTAILFITHDLALASEQTDRVSVLNHGVICETAPTRQIFSAPKTAYTQRLIANLPVFHQTPASVPDPGAPTPQDVIKVASLGYSYAQTTRSGYRHAMQNITFTVPKGRTLGIVGESGSGKTTLLRCLLGLITPQAGTIELLGQDPSRLKGQALRNLRRKVQFVYQNPHVSFDPRYSALKALEEPLINNGLHHRAQRRKLIDDVLQKVRLSPTLLARKVSALSGGQAQRLALARALLCQPEILILDEVVSALDVSIQSEILTLLENLQKDLGLTYIFVSHDLSVIKRLSHEVLILKNGEQIEYGKTEQIFSKPMTDYTKRLIASIPGLTSSPQTAESPDQTNTTGH